jgi:exodeoxyribonuclease V alpha subunit
MRHNLVYRGMLTKVHWKDAMKEGWFQPEEGTLFRIRAKALPTACANLEIEGHFTADRIFVIKRFHLKDPLPVLASSGTPDEFLIHQYTLPNLLNYLYPYELSRITLSEICEVLGTRAIDIIETEPYELIRIPSVPFRVADTLALEKGIAPYHRKRISAAVQYVYLQYLNGGNSYISAAEMENKAYSLLGKAISRDKIRIEIERFAKERSSSLIRRGTLFFDRHLYFAEIQIAERLADLISCRSARPQDLPGIIDRLIDTGLLPVLDEGQREGIEQVFEHQILLVHGEAGTGKTSWISCLLTVLKEVHPSIQIKLAAPTGKAARQITAVSGHPAQTIHAMLGKGKEKSSRIWYHYKKNPLNADVLIVDEASLINEYLWRDLVWSIQRGTKLIFVGDPNQLEPIGPGNPFSDMIELRFPSVTLRRNYRNDSSILALARAILQGEVSDSHLEAEGIEVIYSETVQDTREHIVSRYLNSGKQYPVITMYREQFSLGTDRLNAFMKRRLNPEFSECGMSTGDPVIQTCNTARADNGETGVITSYNPHLTSRVQFGRDKESGYTLSDMMNELELAYSITTAKTQGSQYEGVIIPLIDINAELPHRLSMWYRNSLYSAITRARNVLILIGDPEVLKLGAKRAGMKRRTMLAKRIQSVFEGDGM